MKHLFFLLSIFIFVFTANCQDLNFPINEKGKIEFTGVINTDLEMKQFFENTEIWTVSNKYIVVFENTESGMITIKCMAKGKTSYNPFAGQFTESYEGILKLTYKESKIEYVLSDIYIINNYMGYGMSTTTTRAEEKLATLEKAKADKTAAENNAELSKKQRKNIIEDCDDSIATLTESLRVTRQFVEESLQSLKKEFE